MTITNPKRNLKNAIIMNVKLMITGAKINLSKEGGTLKLIKQIVNTISNRVIESLECAPRIDMNHMYIFRVIYFHYTFDVYI